MTHVADADGFLGQVAKTTAKSDTALLLAVADDPGRHVTVETEQSYE